MTTKSPINQILQGSALEKLKELESESVDCICTSPPYWALRDYKVEGQIGVEKTIDEYINNLIQIFNEAKRVLKKEGTCWVVLGDTYAGTGHKGDYKDPKYENGRNGQEIALNNKIEGIPQKSLCLIPERFAIAMIEDDSSDDYELNNDAPDWVKQELERINYKEQSNNSIEQCHIKTQKNNENISESIIENGKKTIEKNTGNE